MELQQLLVPSQRYTFPKGMRKVKELTFLSKIQKHKEEIFLTVPRPAAKKRVVLGGNNGRQHQVLEGVFLGSY